MKRDRKRPKREYSNYSEFGERRYYGIFKEKGRIKIDVKRLAKIDCSPFDSLLIEKLQLTPKHSAYFKPKFKYRRSYKCNVFQDTIKEISKLWNEEFKQAIYKIKTPKQAGNDAYFNHMCDGTQDPEDAGVTSIMESGKRQSTYLFVIQSLYAQFVLYIGSIIESTTLKVMARSGYKDEAFSRQKLERFITDNYKHPDGKSKKMNKIENHKEYDKFYKLLNFLKHNSFDTYKKLKKVYPEILIEKQFENGNLALGFVKLNDDVIIEILQGLEKYFNSFCETLFNENIEEAQWNYDDYFLEEYGKFLEDWSFVN